MLPRTLDTDAFWQASRHQAGLDHDDYVVASFGDSMEMATELADLVMAGIKRATASLARDYGEGREPTPKPGDFAMMLDGEGGANYRCFDVADQARPLPISISTLIVNRPPDSNSASFVLTS